MQQIICNELAPKATKNSVLFLHQELISALFLYVAKIRLAKEEGNRKLEGESLLEGAISSNNGMAKRGVHLNRKYSWFWIFLIAIMAIITGELINFMMLFLILLTLMEISDELKKRNGRP